MLVILSIILFAPSGVLAVENTGQNATLTAPGTDTAIPHPGGRSQIEPKFLLGQGDAHYVSGKYDDAKRDYERLIARYPSHTATMNAYPKLIFIQANIDHQPAKAAALIKQFLLMKPEPKIALEMKAKLAEVYLDLNKPVEAKSTSNEIIKSTDATDDQKSAALMTIASALTIQKRYTEALAKIDAIETSGNAFLKAHLPAKTLEIKTYQCAALKLAKKKKYSEDDLIDYYSKKNSCFKSILPAGLASDDSKPMNLWCDSQKSFADELTKQKMDSFLKQKISNQIIDTATFARSLNAAYASCKESHEPSSDKK